MIYPANFEVKSGFSTIRSLLHQQCLIDYSHTLVDGITFVTDYDQLKKLLKQTAEMKYILQFVPGFPQQDYYDLTSELVRIRVRGTFLEPDTLPELKLSLETIELIINFLTTIEGEYAELKQLLPEAKPDREIIDRINRITDEKGEIRDNASERLQSIRKEIKSSTLSIDRKISQILNQARKDNLVSDDAELTIRNGRLVIPLPAGNKKKLRGYVHDTSATGQTVFIEPAEVFEINNDIQNLKVEEKQEIINILTDFTDFLRSHIEELLSLYKFLGEIDFIRAKALFAIDFHATLPELTNLPLLEWRNAVHPLLQKSLQKHGKGIVAQNISLDADNRIMIISGPNAGGKSVTLKTVALLQYMLQCGLLIPVADDSTSGIFSKIFLEIGDEQSLENDLSTYSSHLIHIKYFLEHANNSTLFLIDEFGAGTEPQLGGAMAEASLQKLNELGSYGVVTTHYTNLKLLADNEEGLFNAAMLYDTKAMKPLFKLSTGKPGSSFAFEIANKIGFPDEVVRNASSKIGSSQLDFEKQLAQLEVDKKQINQKQAELKAADEMLAELLEKYQKLHSELESRKAIVIKDARQRAQQIIDQTNKLIEKTIREIKEHQAEKEITRQLREELSKEMAELISETEKIEENQVAVQVKPQVKEKRNEAAYILRRGAYVKMEGQDNIGIVEEIKASKASVTFGSFKIRTTIDKLILASPSEIKLFESSRNYQGRGFSVLSQINDKLADFKMSIDLRAQKPEQARESLARYIDQAILLRVNEVRILHGKGNGVLRSLVHDYLSETPEVIRIEDEKLEHGGHGITVVYLH